MSAQRGRVSAVGGAVIIDNEIGVRAAQRVIVTSREWLIATRAPPDQFTMSSSIRSSCINIIFCWRRSCSGALVSVLVLVFVFVLVLV